MRRRQICEARVWTSAVPLSCVASTRPGRCERELDRASHAEAGPPRTDGLAALLPDRLPSARLGRVYEHRGSCLAATSERPRAGRRAAFKRPDERRLSCASRVARLGGVIQKRTAAARVSFEPRHPSDPWTLRSYDRGSGRSIQLGGSPTAGAAPHCQPRLGHVEERVRVRRAHRADRRQGAADEVRVDVLARALAPPEART